MRLFVDGREIAVESSVQSGPVKYPNIGSFVIGAYADGPDVYPLSGALDNIALWDRALAVDAVAMMYASQCATLHFVCPSACPAGMAHREVCVGDVSKDCMLLSGCPTCSAGKYAQYI